MVATAHISNIQPDETEVLMFYRDSKPNKSRSNSREHGTVRRFYRFIYPNLPFEHTPQGEWLESLIRRNSWLR